MRDVSLTFFFRDQHTFVYHEVIHPLFFKKNTPLYARGFYLLYTHARNTGEVNDAMGDPSFYGGCVIAKSL